MSTIARMTCEERPAVILNAAMQMFEEQGFRGISTHALAKADGVSESALNEHFQSTRDLNSAIIEAKPQEGMACAEGRGPSALRPESATGGTVHVVAWCHNRMRAIAQFEFIELPHASRHGLTLWSALR